MALREVGTGGDGAVRVVCVAGESVSCKFQTPRVVESWLPGTTSRASLNVFGERCVPLQGLSRAQLVPFSAPRPHAHQRTRREKDGPA